MDRMHFIALLDQPFEDGMRHPAEDYLKTILPLDVAGCHNWLTEILTDSYPLRPSLCASILRCIGRLDYDHFGSWGMKTIKNALKNEDFEVRDAAIRALEKWGGDASIEILSKHNDTEGWLREYVEQVIIDLSKEKTDGHSGGKN